MELNIFYDFYSIQFGLHGRPIHKIHILWNLCAVQVVANKQFFSSPRFF